MWQIYSAEGFDCVTATLSMIPELRMLLLQRIAYALESQIRTDEQSSFIVHICSNNGWYVTAL